MSDTVERVPMTVSGHKALEVELEELKRERPEIINALAEARSHGDLRENAEYHAARERQGMLEARIKDLEYKLSMAQVIDVATIVNSGRVIFGVTVDLLKVGDNTRISYKIVGDDESDVDQNLIAYTAPIARVLIGRQTGDEVRLDDVSYRIEGVHHNP